MPKGEIPNLIKIPYGCRFQPRCPIAKPDCSKVEHDQRELRPDHFVA